jgi:3-hydroxyisobutyrate dehydrogenase-like beta-hydroxyacid dehydrogenase
MSGKIGLAGVGRMGRPMLMALREAGFEAQGFDIKPRDSYQDFAHAVTDDPAEFSDGLTTLLTVVRDIPQTEDVLFGAQNLLDRAATLKTVIICSTLSPRYTLALKDRVPPRIRLVDAPMSGAVIAAQRKQLSFMLGGSIGDLDNLHPLFNAMGTHFHRMGSFGAGMSAKVLNNLLAASNTAMTRMVLDWADAAGIPEKQLLELIKTSSGQNWLASGFNDIEFARDGYGEDNTIGILLKDVESALDAAPEGSDTTLPRAVQGMIRNLRPRL